MDQRTLAAIREIQQACYAAHYIEDDAVIASRLNDFPHSHWVLWLEQQPAGYLASYLSHKGRVTPFNQGFKTVARPDCLYLHDMAVHPDFRGDGVASRLMTQAVHFAAHCHVFHLALVAVQDARSYWQKKGFTPCYTLEAEQHNNLLTYGPEAVYMLHQLPQQ